MAEALVDRLRAQGIRYHHLHRFHVRMDAGELTREELQRWVSNRFYYQRCIPIKDAAILSNCPEIDVRRVWVQRIIDHDGTSAGTGGIESWLRLGGSLGGSRGELPSARRDGRDRVVAAARRVAGRLARRAPVRAAGAPGGALCRRCLRELRAGEAVDRGGRVVAHGAVRPGRDPRPPRGARGALSVDRSGG